MKRVIRGAARLAFVLIFFLQVFDVNANISVDIQPGSRTISVGETAVFGAVVTSTGGESVSGYQWLMSPNSGGPFTQVGTAAALVLNNVQVTNSGYYFVKVSYQSGTNS